MSGIAITFPSSPSEGQSYLAQNGFTYIYDSQKNRWKRGGEFVRAPKILSYAGVAATTTGSGITTGPTGALIYEIPGSPVPNGEVGVDSYKAYRAAESYPNHTEVQVSISSAFSTIAYAATFTGTTHTIPSNNLVGLTTYYMRARQFVGSNAADAAVGAISGYSPNPIRFITTSTYLDTPTIVSIAATTIFPVYQVGFAGSTLPATVTYTGSGVGTLDRVDWRVTGPRIPSSTGDTALAEVGVGTHSSVELANALVLALPFSGAEGVGITSDVNNAIRTASGASAGTTKTVTANGGIGTATIAGLALTSHFYDGAAYFDGVNDYVTISSSSDLSFGTGNFTIEFWMNAGRFDVDTYYRRMMSIGGSGDNSTTLQMLFFDGSAASNKVNIRNDFQLLNGTIPVVDNRWHHIALTRSGSTLRLFVDGVLDNSTNNTTNFTDGGSTSSYFGRYGALTGGHFNGYLQDLKIYKGLAKYTENFTPPLPTYGTISYTTGTTNTGINTIAFFKSTGDTPTAETPTTTINASVTNNGASDYTFSGDISGNDPNFIIARGSTLNLTVNASGHPFWIQTVSAPYSSGNVVNTGITNNGTQSGIISWTPQVSGTYYYVCQYHSSMAGIITVTESANALVLAMPMNKTFGFQDINVAIRGLTSGASAGTAKTVGLGTTSTANAPTHPRISATESKWYDGAAYFDGGDYATIPSSSDFDFGTGDFTIEVWAYYNSMPSGNGYPSAGWIVGWGPANNNPGFDFAIGSTNIIVSLTNFVSPNISATHNITTGRWYHIAAVRSGNTLSAYINGILVSSVSVSGVTASTNPTGIAIGAAEPSGSTGGNPNVYYQDLKIYKGFAKYTANFTPPQPICGFTTDISTQTGFTTTTASGALLSSVVGLGSTSTLAFDADTTYAGITSITSSSGITTLTDPYASNLVLALPLADITGAGTSFTNDRNTQIRSVSLVGGGSTKTITNSGVTTSTAVTKYYGNSAYFNGSSDIRTPDSDDFYFPGDFTIECWVYRTVVGVEQNIIAKWGGAGQRSWLWFINGNVFRFAISNDGTNATINTATTTTLNANTWYHLCAVGRNGVLNLYVNGILEATSTQPVTYNNTNDLVVGAETSGGLYDFTGYLQDLKIYKGTAKYTTNFTPPPPMFGDYVRSTPNKVVFTPGSDYVLEARNTAIGGIITSTYSATRQWGTAAASSNIADPFAEYLIMAIPAGAQSGITTTYDVSANIKSKFVSSSYTNGQSLGNFSNKVITTAGGVSISSTITKYYGNSMFVPSPGYFDVDFSSYNLKGPFTVEMWIRFPTPQTFGGGNQSGVIFNSNPGGPYSGPGLHLQKYTSSGNSSNTTGPWNITASGVNSPWPENATINANTWYHLAYTRDVYNLCSLWVNGTLYASPAGTNTTDHSTVWRWGYSNGGYSYDTIFYANDIRVYAGVAKYTSNFTPPNQIYYS